MLPEVLPNVKEAPISGCLSHERFTYGAPGENRTHDLRFRKPSLYPLSYRGTQEILRLLGRVVYRVWRWIRWGRSAGPAVFAQQASPSKACGPGSQPCRGGPCYASGAITTVRACGNTAHPRQNLAILEGSDSCNNALGYYHFETDNSLTSI